VVPVDAERITVAGFGLSCSCASVAVIIMAAA